MTKKSPGFLGKFYQIYKENSVSINFSPLSFVQNVVEDSRLSNSLCKARTVFTQKPNKDIIRKESIQYKCDSEVLLKCCNPYPVTQGVHPDWVALIQHTFLFQHTKINQHHGLVQQKQGENACSTLLYSTEFDRIHLPFTVKTLNKQSRQGNFLNLINKDHVPSNKQKTYS